MAGVCWGSCCKGFCSKEGPHYRLEQSARKLSSDKQQSTLLTSLDIPWGFHTQAVMHSLARPRSCKKVSVSARILVRKKGMICVQSNGRSHQKPSAKGGKRKIHRYWGYYQVPTSIFLRETYMFCARNMGTHVWHTSSECQWYKKQDKKSDSHAAKKGMKKLVSSNFAKILEYESSD